MQRRERDTGIFGDAGMKVDLLYGRDRITIKYPDDIKATVTRKHPMSPLADPAGEFRTAIEHPVQSPPLAQLVQGEKSKVVHIRYWRRNLQHVYRRKQHVEEE